jgi:hypothetical protein
VLIEQVDRLNLEALKRAVYRLLDVFGYPTYSISIRRWKQVEPELSHDRYLVAERGE